MNVHFGITRRTFSVNHLLETFTTLKVVMSGVAQGIDDDVDLDLGTAVLPERRLGHVPERRGLHRDDGRDPFDFEVGLECRATSRLDAITLLQRAGDSRADLRLRRRRRRGVRAGGEHRGEGSDEPIRGSSHLLYTVDDGQRSLSTH